MRRSARSALDRARSSAERRASSLRFGRGDVGFAGGDLVDLHARIDLAEQLALVDFVADLHVHLRSWPET